MKWLQGTWIRRYNAFRRLIGRPFQGRYKALLVAPGHAFGQVCHYIHLNPVRARLCEPAEVAGYRWSSLHAFLARSRPGWLDAATALVEAGDLPDSAAGWKSYLHYLEFLATDTTAKRELAAERMSRGWCIGDARFKSDMRMAAKERGADLDRFAGVEPEVMRAERAAAWEERLQALARAADIDLTRLSPQKSDPAKTLLAAALKASTSASNGWIATRLAMGEPASASQFVRRRRLSPTGRREIESLLSRVKT
jgi:putative transposase